MLLGWPNHDLIYLYCQPCIEFRRDINEYATFYNMVLFHDCVTDMLVLLLSTTVVQVENTMHLQCPPLNMISGPPFGTS